MLLTLGLTAALMLMLFIAMAIGALMGRKPISGSCGGIANEACPCSKAEREACAAKAEEADAR
jgi:uncharacterized protein